jgi:hypothetical protein
VAVVVSPERAEQARYLLADAIVEERIRISLTGRTKEGGKWEETTPWDVIGSVDLFASPIHLFEDAIVPAMSGNEKGIVRKTWRGFQLRADSQAAIKNESVPSETGIFLDASVRDAAEIPKYSNTDKRIAALSHLRNRITIHVL